MKKVNIRKFSHMTDHVKVIDEFNRVGMVFEFRFDNGLGVSVADHNGITCNDVECVSVALINPVTDEIIKSDSLDLEFELDRGVRILERPLVKEFLNKVNKFNVVDFMLSQANIDDEPIDPLSKYIDDEPIDPLSKYIDGDSTDLDNVYVE